MKNLLCTSQQWHDNPDRTTRGKSVQAFISFNPDISSIVLVFAKPDNALSINLCRFDSTSKNFQAPENWTTLQLDTSKRECKIIDFTYVQAIEGYYAVLSDGDILRLKNDTTSILAATLGDEVQAASWSPDGSLLALLTARRTVVLMSVDLDILHTSDLSASDQDLLTSHLSVGWGKEETQYRGRGLVGKRDPTLTDKVETGLAPNGDNGITWRGDSQYFVLTLMESDSRRIQRIYANSGALYSYCEPVDGLFGAICFNSPQNLLTGVRYIDGQKAQSVVFFEKNGLRHGGFLLETCDQVTGIAWNFQSTVLAISFGHYYQLWTKGNYHYYLKKEVRLESTIQNLYWHPEESLHLFVATDLEILSFGFEFYIHRGSVSEPIDIGAVAVVDGKVIKFTALKAAIIPPPYCGATIAVESTPIDICLDKTSSQVGALLSNCQVLIAAFTLDVGYLEILSSKSIFFSPVAEGVRLRQLLLVGKTIAILGDLCSGHSYVSVFRLDDTQSTLTLVRAFKLENEVFAFSSIDRSPEIGFFGSRSICTTPPGQCGDLEEGDTVPGLLSITQGISRSTMNKWWVGLSSSGRLYVNSCLCTSGCTSFVAGDFGIYWTSQTSTLNFLPYDGLSNVCIC